MTGTGVAAPDGTSTAQTLTANTGPSSSYLVDYIQNPGQYSSTTMTASVYLRVPSGAANLDLYIINYGASGYSVQAGEAITLTTAWQRFDLTVTNQAALTNAYFQIGGGGSFPAGQSISVWGAQMVLGANGDPYVETNNTTTVTGASQTLAANGLNQSYTYDAFGNLSETGNYNFVQTYTAANQLSGWSYDAAGNLLTDGLGSNYVYDGEGKIVSGAGASYVYSAAGQRVEKSGPALVDTVYFGGQPIARYAGGLWTDLIYGPAGLLAEVPETSSTVSGAPVYRMTDHLGSMVGTLSSTGAVLSTQDIAPFGEIFTGGSTDPFNFTGKERDTESGNDYFGARYYASTMGRFMSPDWSKGPQAVPYANLENPQSLNLYAYVNNNPLSQVDADGHCSDGWHWLCNLGQDLKNGFTGHGFVTDQTRSDRTEARRQWLDQHTMVIHPDGSTVDWKKADEKTIDHWFNQASSPSLAGPNLPIPPGLKGFSDFGKTMGWGSGDAEARARMESLTKEELEKNGVTKEMAEKWRDFYQQEAARNPNNPSAAGRADLMQHAADLLDGKQ